MAQSMRDLIVQKLKNKQYINNADGSISTERGISFQNGNKFYVTPSIVKGVQLDPRVAMRQADLTQTPSFGSQQQADDYSIHRSQQLGKIIERLKSKGYQF